VTQYALVTGATLGIGYEIARDLAKRGHDLVLVARTQEKLEYVGREIASEFNVEVQTIRSDLGEPGAGAQLVVELERRGLEIDILVNNAGRGLFGFFHELPLAESEEIIQLNITALTDLCALLIPPMVARGRGRVMNVGSVAGFQPGPKQAVYHATKAYVLMLSQAMHAELAGTGVTVTTLCPGFTATEFGKNAGIAPSKALSMVSATAGPVARAGVKAMLKGKPVVVPTPLAKTLKTSSRLFPMPVVLWASNQIMSKGRSARDS
jgi:short-subunit dehydrogenase